MCLFLTEEDATEAVKHGVAGIVVSNHGGRQLDGVLATVGVNLKLSIHDRLGWAEYEKLSFAVVF